ncbi:MAG: methyltransferase domain-containing protein [Planctomycetes bacterium]|nr:methyltransferase domain-containing protein [Planctomycetota bacterium]
MTNVDYDAGWTERWDDMKRYGPASRHTRRLIFELLEGIEFRSVLDAGCGQGELLGEIAARRPGASLRGVDLSEAGIVIAARRLPGARFSPLDLSAAPLHETFDLVVCSDVLEHVEEDRAALANLRRMTNGHLLVTTIQGPCYPWEKETMGHVRSYTRRDLENKLSAAGFRVERVIEWGWPFYSPLYRSFLTLGGGGGTTGTFGRGRRIISSLLYALFRLNSSRRGDGLFVLARAV